MTYDELLARAKEDIDSVDFTALRYAFVKSPDYSPFERNGEASESLNIAMERQNLPAAIEAVHAILETDYLQYDAHVSAGDIYSEMCDEEKSRYHKEFARGILVSIFESGNGRSFETAFAVISESEELNILKILGLKHISKTPVVHQGHEYDVMVCVNPKTRGKGNVYFNIDSISDWITTNMNSPKE